MESDTMVETVTTATEDRIPETTTLRAGKKKGRKWLWGAAIGLLAALATVGAVLGTSSHSSASGASDSSSVASTPPTDPATALDSALAPWTQYIANNHNSGATYWASTVGVQNPVYQLPIQSAAVFWSEQYQVGASQAGTDAYKNLMNACTQFMQQNPNFDPSMIPAAPASGQ